jgi:hypothetical protein
MSLNYAIKLTAGLYVGLFFGYLDTRHLFDLSNPVSSHT